MTTEPEPQGVGPILRRLGIAVKTAALYGTSHPMARHAVEGLLEVLRPYLDTSGAFAARVTKRGFVVDGVEYERGAHRDLAVYLYTRKIAYLRINPNVHEAELISLLSVAGMDRVSLETAGGVEYLLWQAAVRNIKVTETALDRHELLGTLGLDVALALLDRGRLSPQEREVVVDILRAGPDQITALLENLRSTVGEVHAGAGQDAYVQQLFRAIKSLDRIILDEPLEDQAPLYGNLAEAIVRIDASLRPVLARLLLSAADEDVARVIVNHLDGEQLADLVVGSLSPGDVGEQVAAFVRGLFDDGQKAKAVLSVLERRLRPPGSDATWLSDAVWPQLQSSSPRPEYRTLPFLEFDDIQAPGAHREADRRFEEAQAIDEATVTGEAIATLVDVFQYEDDDEAREATAAVLERHLPWLVDRQEFALLAVVLRSVRRVASGPDDGRRTLAGRILSRVAAPPLLDRVLAALWAARETDAERGIRECLQVLGDELIRPLVGVLEEEPRAAMRAMVCDLLVVVGRGHVDDLGRYLNDARWYLVRNLASVLGRVRDPRAVPYLGRLAGHEEYRVRREAVDGLAAIGTEDAQVRLAELIDDLDQRIRLRAMRSLDASGARRAMPRLIGLLNRPDLFGRQFVLRRAALEVLERVGAQEALPALKRIARRRFVLGARAGELRRLAGRAVRVIEAPPAGAGGHRAGVGGGGWADD